MTKYTSAVVVGLVAAASAAECTIEQATAVAECMSKVPLVLDPKDAAGQCVMAQGMLDCYVAQDCQKGGVDMCATIAEAQKTCPDLTCSSSCFPATATVLLADNSSVQMAQLKEGDKVAVGSGAFSDVYMFSTQLEASTSKFTEITCGSRTPLLLTATHYLYVNGKLAQAGSVQVGDELTLANGKSAAVTSVGSAWLPGLYNPHTLDGDIVVDGFLTSTYTGAVHPTLAHALLYPVRQMYQFGSAFGGQFSAAAKGVPDWVRKAISAAN